MNKIFQNRRTLWKHLLVISLTLGSLVILLLQTPMQQDIGYHHFADTRIEYGISNFQNVLSNLPFLLLGLAGVFVCARRAGCGTKSAWMLFYSGIALVGLGSVYYHLNPNNDTLLWDRLPMAMGFMALFAALLGELIAVKLTYYFLFPLILIGFASVMVWHWFDDLRFYVWVQFMPMLVIPLMLLLYPKRYTHTYMFVLALLIYIIAKVFEVFDMEIFSSMRGVVAGHAMKHIAAATGSGVLLWMLCIRKPLVPVSGESRVSESIRHQDV